MALTTSNYAPLRWRWSWPSCSTPTLSTPRSRWSTRTPTVRAPPIFKQAHHSTHTTFKDALQAGNNMDYPPTKRPESARTAVQRTPCAPNGPTHPGLCCSSGRSTPHEPARPPPISVPWFQGGTASANPGARKPCNIMVHATSWSMQPWFVQQTRTVLQGDGPIHLGLWAQCAPCAPNGPNHLGFVGAEHQGPPLADLGPPLEARLLTKAAVTPHQHAALLKHPCQSTFPTPHFKRGVLAGQGRAPRRHLDLQARAAREAGSVPVRAANMDCPQPRRP